MTAQVERQAVGRVGGERPRRRANRVRMTVVAVVSLAVLLAGVVWALSIGSQPIPLSTVLRSVFGGDSPDETIVQIVRLPRVVLAVVVGANLAVSGALMQGITANPLASPDIMGVNAGAAVCVVLAVTTIPVLVGTPSVLLAFVGAAAAGITVMVLAGMGGGRVSPVRLTLAGVTASTLLISLTQVLVIFHENDAQRVLFWLVGGVNSANWDSVGTVLPWTVAGLAAAMALARAMNLLALGEDMARGLGQNVERTRALGAAVVIVLCGASVAVAGPIAFIGLIVPHIARRLVGTSYAAVLPVCVVVGAALTVYADIASRFVNPPFEVPSGVVSALIGAPIFIYLARRQKATT
ncbi:FecCD family ABC transporter permease [Actinophytocola oryzae]|uniref:Iron complex transport system permease protein n=1 Tax=Actinophytocola oryzae TaxID=502181 RepID=A0A4R7VL16_9PSEU|nr:iron ABC transporter permease [Actinophytocola oryzae]TDV49965.1 iron complex transport system permease protein [Actinophytocola oryzae]